MVMKRALTETSSRGFYNSQMPSRMIRKQCELDDAGERTLEMAVRRMGLSARARPHSESGAHGGRPGRIASVPVSSGFFQRLRRPQEGQFLPPPRMEKRGGASF